MRKSKHPRPVQLDNKPTANTQRPWSTRCLIVKSYFSSARIPVLLMFPLGLAGPLMSEPVPKWLCILRVRPQNPTSTPTPSRTRYPGCPPLTSIPLQSSPSPAMSPQLSNPWLPWLTGRTKQWRDTYQAEWHPLVLFRAVRRCPSRGPESESETPR
ncbi:hypothetical protein BGZ61DRAFT_3002 [Ilyonectria robusta]|uniref:uncharacterized protein n=1 Tax=Ilyonectria robusta TaxID=1079257 RepID=UPI001E8DDB91|nr:uncharacterized protein BGZ61DRAFT_3002 [Ilyonectria robusta]KAH8736782.1 hypothetical protein BGZ61DRAFT_3002 [Ilyonectria robusta]